MTSRRVAWRAALVAASALVVASALVACAGKGREGVFRDQPVIWRVADREPIVEPERRGFGLDSYVANALFLRRLTRAVVPPGGRTAGNINALDEVPDSTWFTNRVGHVGQATLADVVLGPVAGVPIEPPLRLVEAVADEEGGARIEVIDAHGNRYRLVFDTEMNPEQRTTAGIVTAHLLWAAGYNVPSHQIHHFRLDDLVVGSALRPATKRAMTAAGLDAGVVEAALARASRRPRDGRLRALAVGSLAGREKGGWRSEGRRGDDTNDVVRHEHRRELRGLRVFAAWVNFTDIKENNTVDLYVERADGGYLVHYLRGFERALGALRAETAQNELGFEYAWDMTEQAKAFVSLGMYTRPWELQPDAPYPSIGRFSAQSFDPARWRERYPYWPFWMLDRADAFWAAKIAMAFEREMIEAAVSAARLSNPEAAEYLVETLWTRRARIGARYFAGISPLDWFEVEDFRLCMTDLALHHGVAYGGVLDVVDARRRAVETHSLGQRGRVCVPIAADGRYRVLRLRVKRAERAEPPVDVHYIGGLRPRILGVVRHTD